jgi:hypothetical protein
VEEKGNMTKKSRVEKEVQELRHDAARLAKEEAARAAVPNTPKSELPSVEREDRLPTPTKVEEFLDSLQKDLRNMPATAAVGFFALGVLLGRLLRR